MIFIRLSGGLGNQLFQLCAGLVLSKKVNMDYSFYLEGLKSYNTPRSFMLGEIADELGIKEKGGEVPFLCRLIVKYRVNKIITFFSWNINENNLERPNPSSFYIVDDYFQSVQFIEHTIAEIRFIVNKICKQKYFLQDVLLKIKEFASNEIIVLHIRRGDYINVKENKNLFCFLDKEYYQKGIEEMSINIPYYLIFSDETDEAKINIGNWENVLLARDFELSDFEEFLLMTQFSNYIIANSTYSFWAATLSNKLNKKVIAPRNWSHLVKENIKWVNNLRLLNYKLI